MTEKKLVAVREWDELGRLINVHLCESDADADALIKHRKDPTIDHEGHPTQLYSFTKEFPGAVIGPHAKPS